jgi:hypothetical protein
MSSRRALAILAACAWAAAGAAEDWVQSGDVLRQTLDERTALVLTGLNVPMVLYRENPHLAANAREYVQVGPLEVNRQGELRYYVWMGIWSTFDRGPAAGVERRFEHVYLFADEEPMELTVTSWGLSDHGADVHFYNKPVATGVDAFYAVTADQLRRIGTAREVYLIAGPESRQRYDTWEWNPAALTAFADYTGDREIR